MHNTSDTDASFTAINEERTQVAWRVAPSRLELMLGWMELEFR